MKKKSGIIVAVVVLVLCFGIIAGYKIIGNEGASQVNQNSNVQLDQSYEVKSYITDEMRENSQDCITELCLVEEFTPEKLKSDADNIVLATVISLDDADPDGSLVGMTNGKLLIDNVLRGDLTEGQVINYSKPGGMMKMSEWEETQPDAANLKRQYLRSQSGNEVDLDSTYINLQLSGDIEIEAGKTYLVYLKNNNSKYEIIGLESGLRELNVTQNTASVTTQDLDTTSLMIKNNETGEFESLQDYIDAYINNDIQK